MLKYAKLLLVVLAAAVLLLAGPTTTRAAGFLLDRVVAVVNDEAITWGELYRAMEFEMARNMQALSPEQKRAVFKKNETAFLEQMIDQRLQVQAGRKMGIKVGEAEISAAIESIQKKFGVDAEAFRDAIFLEGFTMEEYREKLAIQITVSRVLEKEVRGKVAMSAEDLEKISSGDAEVRVRQILLKVSPEDEDAKEVRARAGELMKQLRGGADFVEFAIEHSEGPLGPEGGDFGFIKKSNLSSEFADAVEGLSPGDLGGPFQTDAGIHIIKLEEVKSMREVIMEKRFTDEYKAWLRHLRESAFIEVRL